MICTKQTIDKENEKNKNSETDAHTHTNTDIKKEVLVSLQRT